MNEIDTGSPSGAFHFKITVRCVFVNVMIPITVGPVTSVPSFAMRLVRRYDPTKAFSSPARIRGAATTRIPKSAVADAARRNRFLMPGASSRKSKGERPLPDLQSMAAEETSMTLEAGCTLSREFAK